MPRSQKQLHAIFRELKRERPHEHKYGVYTKKKRVGTAFLPKYTPKENSNGFFVSVKSKQPRYYVDLSIDKKYQGRGLGTQTYQHVRRVVPKHTKEIAAFIKDENIPSIKSAEHAGFKKSKLFSVSPERLGQFIPKTKYYRKKSDRYSKWSAGSSRVARV